MDKGINIYIDLRDQSASHNSQVLVEDGLIEMPTVVVGGSDMQTSIIATPKPLRKSRGGGLNSFVKTHPMKTRRSKLNSSNALCDGRKKLGKRVTWNLAEEITKVIEREAALGVNFRVRSSNDKYDNQS